MTSNLKKLNLHDNWSVDDSDVANGVIHFYHKNKYYTTVDKFYESEIELDDIIKMFNRDVKIQKIIE